MSAVLGLTLLGMLLAAGCEEGDSLGGWTWQFHNSSSYVIRVWPNGQTTWVGFSMSPGDKRDVRVNEDNGTIYYFYDHQGQVRVDSDPKHNNHITFSNR